MKRAGHTESSVGVLDKAVAVLRSFPAGGGPSSARELAERASLTLPTVYRLLQSLETHGFVERDAGRGYRLGLTLMHLGSRVALNMDLRRQVSPHLVWLNDQTGENAELQIRRGESRVLVEMVRSVHNLRPFVEIGEPLPLHLGAGGKMLLAMLTDEQSTVLIQQSLDRFGADTEFDRARLQDQLKRIRVEGCAVTREERSPGVAAIAAPILDVESRVAGVVDMSLPSARLTDESLERMRPLVIEAARRASSSVGYSEEAS